MQIATYFYPANMNVTNIPAAISADPGKAPGFIDTAQMDPWGQPQTYFGADYGTNSSCQLSKFFGNHEIIFDTTCVLLSYS